MLSQGHSDGRMNDQPAFSSVQLCRLSGFIVTLTLLIFVGHARAAIAPGDYTLRNHPDGQQNPPPYGLRLDELINVTGGNDVFTFDFDHASSAMNLSLSGTTAHIYGSVFGGRDSGNAFDPAWSTLWTVDFTYQNVVPVPGDDDLHVTGTPNGMGPASGTITGTIGSSAYEFQLRPKADGSGLMLRLGDENDDLGHRGYDGISGWGWLQHLEVAPVGSTDWRSGQFSDWLFVVVPEPGTWLGASLLLLLTVPQMLAWRRGRMCA